MDGNAEDDDEAGEEDVVRVSVVCELEVVLHQVVSVTGQHVDADRHENDTQYLSNMENIRVYESTHKYIIMVHVNEKYR